MFLQFIKQRIRYLFLFPYFTLFAFPFFLSQIVYAESPGSAKINYATGKQSQTDCIEDRDLSGDFTFYRYGISVTAAPSKDLSCKLGFSDYKKDFETLYDALDARTNTYKGSVSLPIYKTDKYKFSSDTDYGLRTKRYKNNPSSDYDENSFSGIIKIGYDELYSLGLSGGFKDYDYIKKSDLDRLKTFLKVSPEVKFLDKKLTLGGYYKKQWVKRPDNEKDYTEDTFSADASLKIDMPAFNKIRGGFEYGRNDTQDDEEDREDILKFKYREWDVTTYHTLHENVETRFTYGQKHRDYITSLNSYDSWLIKNKTNFALLKKEPFNLDLLVGAEHRETDFGKNQSLGYNKNSLSAGFNILKKENWSLKPEFNFTKYDYPPHSTSNQKTYKAEVALKKYIGSTDNAFEVNYWYKWKDYRYKSDIEQWTLNLSYAVSF